MATEFNLWREYQTPPFQRWACTVTESEDAESGYKIVEHDIAVADAVFLHRLHDYLLKPHPVHTSVVDPDGLAGIIDRVGYAHAGEPGHFAEAIRSVPGASLGGRRPTL